MPKPPARLPTTSKPAKSHRTAGRKVPQTNPPPPPQPAQSTRQLSTSEDEQAHQQALLDVFSTAFLSCSAQSQDHNQDQDQDQDQEQGKDGEHLTPGLNVSLQQVKQALFERDFARAFGRPEYLDVYAARWSPTRALCYARVLGELEGELRGLVGDTAGRGGQEQGQDPTTTTTKKTLRILSIGGGTAELAALSTLLLTHPSLPPAHLTLLDAAPWVPTLTKLHHALTTPPPLSDYASATARASNAPFLPPSRLVHAFSRADVLGLSEAELARLCGDAPVLLTLFFTLNELYTAAGVAATTAFLKRLGVARPGSLVLVLDSAGSYAEVGVGERGVRYPMGWLVDRTLVGKHGAEGEGEEARWVKVSGEEAVWFRLGQSLRYPVTLEDMRFQVRLYRAVGGGDG